MKKIILFFGLTFLCLSFLKAQNVYIPDANFKAYLVGNPNINTNGDNEIQTTEAINVYGGISVADKGISDLTGIGAFINITELVCHLNSLTTLDVSNNKFLRNISCFNNQLTSLILGNNTVLEKLWCRNNQLNNLDISKNPSLTILECYNNQLTKLNLKNGANSVLNFMNALGNPNLSCIQVDNIPSLETKPNWHKDSTASYATDCGYLSLADIIKKGISVYPNPAKDIINFSEEVSNIKITDFSGKVLKQITNSEKSINVSKLAKGIYIITATSKSGELINKKLIKE